MAPRSDAGPMKQPRSRVRRAAATAVLACVSTLAASPGLQPGPDLVTARQGSRAVRLADGSLVFYGGHGRGFVSLATAEVWSPESNAFQQLAMQYTHDTPCFTRLADGRVLLAGGSANLGIPQFATSELHDPVAGTFTPVGNMVRFRAGGGAVQLAGGRVLIAGAWWTHNDAHTHAELFDPTTGQFTATGTLNTPRAYPVVVALDDGDALVIGGTGPNGQVIGSRIERYRAAQGDFVAVTDQLFPGEDGWTASEPPRPQVDQRLADGRHVFLASRSASGVTRYALFTVDPATGQIGRLATQPDLPDTSVAGLFHPVPTPDGTRVLLPAVRVQTEPPAYFAMSLDVASGVLAVPDPASDVVPGYRLDGTAHVTPDGRVLVAGGSENPDNFTAVARTSFLIPAEAAAPLLVAATWVPDAPGGPRLEISWPESEGELAVESVGELGAVDWQVVPGASAVVDGRRVFGIPVDAESGHRFYRARRP